METTNKVIFKLNESNGIFYFLRFALTLFLFCWIVRIINVNNNYFLSDPQMIADYFGAMDLWRALFLAMFPTFVLLFLFPGKWIRKIPFALLVPILALLCAFSVIFPFYMLQRCRDIVTLHWIIVTWILLIALNLFGYFLFQHPRFEKSKSFNRFIRLVPFLTDLLIPMIVFGQYQKGERPLPGWLKIAPAAFLAISLMAVSIPNFIDESSPKLHREIAEVYSGRNDTFYAAFDPSKDVLWSSKLDEITKMDFSKGGFLESNVAIPIEPFEGRGAKKFALSADHSKMMAAGIGPKSIRIMQIDADTMAPDWIRRLKIEAGERLFRSSTFWDQKRDLLLVTYDSGYWSDVRTDAGDLYHLASDGSRIYQFISCGNVTDALLLPEQRIILVLYLQPGLLASFDADTLEMKGSLPLPKFGDQLALDRQRNLLYASFPREGLIRQIDLETLQVTGKMYSVFGVRSLQVIEEMNLLVAGGLSPYVELFDLGSLNLVGRIVSPPWIRMLQWEPVTKTLFFSTNMGVYKWPLGDSDQKRNMPFFERMDPFFGSLNIAARILSTFPFLHSAKATKQDILRCRIVHTPDNPESNATPAL
ncbi:MAG TPA: hypothetical protein PKW95_15640 [bacterium]|nr:hypothetical protein [bacterium]